jgi:hypothetical protein
MKVSGGSLLEFYFLTGTHPAYGETGTAKAEIIGDNEFHTYTLDMSKVQTWKGIVTEIILYPTNAATNIEIDYIHILP